MAELATTAPTQKLSVMDLEEPIVRARYAAKTLEMVLEAILESKHPQPAPEGCRALLLDGEEFEAAAYAMGEVRSRLKEVSETWETLFHDHCRNR